MKFLRNIIVFTLSTLALTACVDEALVDQGKEEWKQGDTPFYIKLRLKTNSETFTRSESSSGQNSRAYDKFEDGVHENEHAICPNARHFAIFFDENKEYISCADLYSVNEEGGHEDATETSPAVESTYTCRFYGFADTKPKYVLVVVNAPQKIYDQITDFPGWDIDDVMKNQIWNEPGILQFKGDELVLDSKGLAKYENDPRENLGFYPVEEGGNKELYFTMTNSTYVEGYPTDPKVCCAQEFPDGSVTKDKSNIDDLKPVTVYLERMVSKFDLTSKIEVTKYIPTNVSALDMCEYKDGVFTYTEYPWAIEILSWGMNGLETSSHLFKNLPMDEGENKWLSGLNQTKWNDVLNHRSYWSKDPHYYKDNTGRVVYPWQYDFAMDKYDADNQTYYNHFHSYDNHEDDADLTHALTYYSFLDLCPRVNKDGVVSGSFNPNAYFYTPENTFEPGMIVDRSRGTRSYELAGTHIILCARLLLPDASGKDYQAYNRNLYRNRVGVSYINEVSMLEDFMNAVNYKLHSSKYMYYKYYPWDKEEIHKNNIKKNKIDEYQGHTLRTHVEGEFGIYCYFPGGNPLLDELDITDEDGATLELTYQLLQKLMDNNQFQLYREADAINADGKVIPWIMSWNGETGEYEPLTLLILRKVTTQKEIDEKIKFGKAYDNDKTKGECILGDPTEGDCHDYLSGYEGYTGRKIEFQKYVNGKWTQYVEGERDNNDIQSLFFEIWGVADCFKNGLMYYAVPIPALGDNGKPVVGAATLDLNANQEFANDESLRYYYGVIRNNWYRFTLHSISDIGIPVFDPKQPIVPNYTNKKDQLKMEMEILQWHVEDMNVDIEL